MNVPRQILADVKQCIYCHTREDRLSEEHIVPYGLNGGHILLNASCAKCSEVTSKIELHVLRETFISIRKGFKFRSRRNKTWDNPKDAFTSLIFTLSEPPAHLTGKPYTGGVNIKGFKLFALKTPHSQEKARASFRGNNFERMLAKIGLGFAVGQYGIEAFQQFYVLPSIMDHSNDVGRWVGAADDTIMPHGQFGYDLRDQIVNGDVVYRIKLFAMFDVPEYLVVVGKLKGKSPFVR